MKGFVPPDPETGVSTLKFAAVRVPRATRKRLPAACVTVCASAAEALACADADRSLRAARVLGPSKSSEGQFIYYLMEWLESSSDS